MNDHHHDIDHNHSHEHTCDGHHHHHGHEECHHEGCHHDHDHGHHCCDDPSCNGHHTKPIEISAKAQEFLTVLGGHSYLPLAQFVMTSSKSSHFQTIALSPVYLTLGTETVAEVREMGTLLTDLEDMGLITLDHDQPLENYDYGLYRQSASFHALEDAIRESSQQEGFLFDNAAMETGSIAMTDLGHQVFHQFGHTHK